LRLDRQDYDVGTIGRRRVVGRRLDGVTVAELLDARRARTRNNDTIDSTGTMAWRIRPAIMASAITPGPIKAILEPLSTSLSSV